MSAPTITRQAARIRALEAELEAATELAEMRLVSRRAFIEGRMDAIEQARRDERERIAQMLDAEAEEIAAVPCGMVPLIAVQVWREAARRVRLGGGGE